MFFLCTFLRGVLLSVMPKRILWAEKCSLECFFSSPLPLDTLGLFADGHMLCSLLMKKKPLATFGEAHWIGRRLHWNLKQHRPLKSASGTMRQSSQSRLYTSSFVFALKCHTVSDLQHTVFSNCASIIPWSQVMNFLKIFILSLRGWCLKKWINFWDDVLP